MTRVGRVRYRLSIFATTERAIAFPRDTLLFLVGCNQPQRLTALTLFHLFGSQFGARALSRLGAIAMLHTALCLSVLWPSSL